MKESIASTNRKAKPGLVTPKKRPLKNQALLQELRELNSKLNTKERKDIFERVKQLISKNCFNHMVSGVYIAKANVEIGRAILKRMKQVVEDKGKAIHSI